MAAMAPLSIPLLLPFDALVLFFRCRLDPLLLLCDGLFELDSAFQVICSKSPQAIGDIASGDRPRQSQASFGLLSQPLCAFRHR
jgi:hypothetical protein